MKFTYLAALLAISNGVQSMEVPMDTMEDENVHQLA